MTAPRRWPASIALVVVVATGVRCCHLWEVRDSPRQHVLIGDAGRYHAWAREIAAGDWIGSGTFYQAPLYPYALAIVYAVCGPDPATARQVQAVLGVLSCVVLMAAGRAFFGPTAGVVAGLLLALTPAEVFHESLLDKAVLTTLLTAALIAALGAALRSPRQSGPWWWAGVALGLLSLSRENALLLAPVVLGWSWWLPRSRRARDRTHRVRAALFVVAGLAVTLGPVLVRNRIVGGEWQLTTAQFGPNFYIGNHAGADGLYLPLAPEHGTAFHEQADATRMATEASGRSLTAGEVDAWWTRRALTDIRQDPAAWLTLLFQKLALTWTNVEPADSEDQYTAATESRMLRVLMSLLPFGVLTGIATCGAVWLGSHWRRVWIVPGLIVTYSMSVALCYVFARYRLPLVPMLALVAGAGVARGLSLCRRGGWGRVTTGIVAGALAAAATSPRVVGRAFDRWPDLSTDHMQGVTQFNLALRNWEQDAPREVVERHLAESLRLHPGYASAWLYWGYVLVDVEDRAAAAEKISRAAELDPDGADIRIAQGENLLHLGLPQAALPPLERAVQLAPADVEALHLLGRARYLNGRLDDALEPLQAAVRLDPEALAARRLLAITLDQVGRRLEAEEEFEELRRRLPAESPEFELIERRLNQRTRLLRKR